MFVIWTYNCNGKIEKSPEAKIMFRSKWQDVGYLKTVIYFPFFFEKPQKRKKRLFCGDLGNEVTDEILTRAFSKYPSFLKAKVIREKGPKMGKTKGYGFISFR